MSAAVTTEPLFDVLEVGKTYRAYGPAEGSKQGPPQVAEIVGTSAKGYITKGQRQVATLIAFGCERFWRRVD